MSTDDDGFLQRLLATFKGEAAEHLEAMAALLLALERSAPGAAGAQLLESLFREVHSLKGAARSVDLADLESVCHAFESVAAALKKGRVAPSAALFDTLHASTTALAALCDDSVAGRPEWERQRIANLVDALERLQGEAPAPREDSLLGIEEDATASRLVDSAPVSTPTSTPPSTSTPTQSPGATPAAPDAAVGTLAPAHHAAGSEPARRHVAAAPMLPVDAPDMVRVSSAKLGVLLRQAEEHLSLKSSAAHMLEEIGALRAALGELKKSGDKSAREVRALRRSGERQAGAAIDAVFDRVELCAAQVKDCDERVRRIERDAEHKRRALCGLVDNFLDHIKQVLMQPFSSLFAAVQPLVRAQSRACGKEIELVLEGGATEVDRRILDHLKAPLIHLVSNAIDHGIEAPAQRSSSGKSAIARIVVAAVALPGNKIALTVRDDGAGIDLARVAQAARRLELASEQELAGMGDEQLTALIFESGFSTAPILTDTSGRGLGLAIVRAKLEALGGSIALREAAGGGCEFQIHLPSTLATFRGIVVALGASEFVLPARNVERVARVLRADLVNVANGATVELAGAVMSLLPLAAILGLAPDLAAQRADTKSVVLLVLVAAGKRIAVQVDAVIGEQEVLVKELGPVLQRVRHIAGATITGPGKILPVLHVEDIVTSAQHIRVPSAYAQDQSDAVGEPAEHIRRKVLVVDDSVTSRSLLKNILESADYEVDTAVDGMDALLALRSGKFDILVSDVDMPRMNGFDLTARVRADKALSDLPVILVTSLDSREHKEQGIDVGASAYIVKSSFEQSNLLEMVRRLL